jgi:hypothetical protein
MPIGLKWPYLATAVLAALTGGYVWTRPRRPGTRSFGLLAAALRWHVCQPPDQS